MVAIGRQEYNFFHHFTNERKASNTIWSKDIMDGSKSTSFEEIVEEGIVLFKILFKVDLITTIDTIL
jgi:hypothetical protein